MHKYSIFNENSAEDKLFFGTIQKIQKVQVFNITQHFFFLSIFNIHVMHEDNSKSKFLEQFYPIWFFISEIL